VAQKNHSLIHKDIQGDPRIYTSLDALMRLEHRARGFSFLPKQPMNSILSGRHNSRLRGRGLNFEELRGYLPGDDIRNIDWKVTARTREAHVRVYTEERDRTVWLLVDQRVSQFFGSREKMKSVIAAEAAALAAWRVRQQGDRVGAVIFNDTSSEVVPPQRSHQGIALLLSRIVVMNQQLSASADIAPNPGAINDGLGQLAKLARHDCLLCLVTDGFGLNRESRRIVTRITRHNDVITALVFDPMERELSQTAGPALIFSDGRQQLAVNSNDSSLRTRFAQSFDDRLHAIEELSRRFAIPVLPINSHDDVATQIRDLLHHGRQGTGV
jgi:uncharacterized protein (DUF58 family)